MLEFLIAISPLLAVISIIMVIMFTVFYVNTVYTLEEKSTNSKTRAFIESLSDSDEILVTLSDSNDYRTYVYAKVRDKYLNFEYSKLTLHVDPQSLSLDDLTKTVNYLYSITGKNFIINDLTDNTKQSIKVIDSLSKIKKSDPIEGSVEKLEDYRDESNLLN